MFRRLRELLKPLPFVWHIIVITLLAHPAGARDVTVGTSEEISKVLDEIRISTESSWTIFLRPGVYDSVLIKDIVDPVTLIAAESRNRPRLAKLTVADSANVTFKNLVFDYVFPGGDEPLWAPPFRLYRSRNVTFDTVLFDGDIYQSASPIDDGFPGGQALIAQNMKGLDIRNSEVRGFWLGVTFFRSDDINFVGNDLHSLRKDGMNLAQVRNVLIEDNVFHDFDRSPNSDDHADYIQLFSTNTDKPSVGVTIRNNVFNSGRGLYTQSIFFRNDRVDTGQDGKEMFFRDILVEDNVIINAHLHGITIGETDGLIIRNNTLIRNRGSEGPGFSDDLASPQINVAAASRNVQILGNIAYRFPAPQARDWKVRDNLAIQDIGRGKSGFYDLVFENARTGDPQDLASFRYRPDGPAAGRGIGAPQLEPQK